MADFLDLLVTKTRAGADLASADPLLVGVDGDRFNVTGTTNITTIDTNGRGVGARFYLVFAGILTLTNSANLEISNGADLTTAAGDCILFEVTADNKVAQVSTLQKVGTGVSAVSVSAPLTSTGGATPTLGIDEVTESSDGSMIAADKVKLDGIAASATANQADSYLLDRANQTGEQAESTITDLTTDLAACEQLANKATDFTTLNDVLYPNVQAVQNLVNAAIEGRFDDRGNYDSSGNTYPSSGGSGASGAILKGDTWTCSVAGVLNSLDVSVGDWIRALADSPGTTDANWAITGTALPYVPENVVNKATTFGTLNNTLYPTTQAVASGALAFTNKDLTDSSNTFPTFNQSTTGNAATATKLATARNINGVAFDGTADINVGGLPTLSVVASEALTANKIVNLWNNAGTTTAQLANATDATKTGIGFVTADVDSAANATVYFTGNIITGLSGLTPGATEYLSTTGGSLTETAPTTAGQVVQVLGTALSSTSMIFNPGVAFTL